MKNAVVFDAGVLALHFIGDPRVEEYIREVDSERIQGHMSSVNLAEFYYKTCQKIGRQTADIRYYQIRSTALRVVDDGDLVRSAGLEKCRQLGGLSLADCFALALTKRERALLLTTDRELAKVKGISVKLFEV